jgi:hypothetical protein
MRMPPANVMDRVARGNSTGAGNDRNMAVGDGIGTWLNEKVGGAAGPIFAPIFRGGRAGQTALDDKGEGTSVVEEAEGETC